MIGVSQKVLDCIQKRIDIREKGKVVYNGVDIDKFYPTDKKKRREIHSCYRKLNSIKRS